MYSAFESTAAADSATLDAAQQAIDRMVAYLCEDERDRRDRWVAGARTPDEVHRRLLAWREREARLQRRAACAA